MSPTDWVLLAIVVVSALLGVWRGFVGVLASLAAWLLAGWAAFHFGAQLAKLLAFGATPGAAELFGGYAISFVVVLLCVGLVGWLIQKWVKSTGLSGMDRALGFGVGVARGAFVACVLVLLLGFTALPQRESWRQSSVIPVFVPGAEWLRTWLPQWAAAEVNFGDKARPAEGGKLDIAKANR